MRGAKILGLSPDQDFVSFIESASNSYSVLKDYYQGLDRRFNSLVANIKIFFYE
jgi:hypothetical protein